MEKLIVGAIGVAALGYICYVVWRNIAGKNACNCSNSDSCSKGSCCSKPDKDTK